MLKWPIKEPVGFGETETDNLCKVKLNSQIVKEAGLCRKSLKNILRLESFA